MASQLEKVVEEYLKPVQGPAAISSRETVKKAIEFNSPERIPCSFVNPLKSDFFECVVLRALFDIFGGSPPKNKGDVYYDEWGVGQKVTGRGWDHAFDHPLKELEKLAEYRFPDIAAPETYDRYKLFISKANVAGKYVVGYDPIMMFERLRSLLGFEELMIAPYTQPDGLKELLGRMTDLTIRVIDQWSVTEGLTDDDLRSEVAEMVREYHRFGGGFMARQYPQPRDIQLSEERHLVIADAFFENGCRI